MNTKGTLYTIGERVRLRSGGPEMLIVDMDPARSSVIAAWKSGDAVSERSFEVAALRPAAS